MPKLIACALMALVLGCQGKTGVGGDPGSDAAPGDGGVAVDAGDSAVHPDAAPPGVCGDGVLSAGEVCDDGNTTSGDGCAWNCLSDETCGNGIVDFVALEDCDEGGANADVPNATCRTDCTAARCGDGITDDAAGEQCDDGNNVSGDGCARACSSDETCGNGILDDHVGELCDDGNNFGGDGCGPNCDSDETCGNGIVDSAAGEVCDDGNVAVLDGCDDSCQIDDIGVATGGGNQVHVAVAMAPDGRFVVVWGWYGQDGSGTAVFGRLYQADGRPTSAPFQLNVYTAGDQTRPEVSMAADGSFVATWQSAGQDGDGLGIVARRFDAAGSPLGSEVAVNTTAVGDQELPDVALVRTDGSYVVVWQSGGGQDGDGVGVYARLFSGQDVPLSGELPVNETTAGDQVTPRVSAVPDDSFLVTWESVDPAGTNAAVAVRRYAASGVPIIGESVVSVTGADYPRGPDVALRANGASLLVWREGVYSRDIFMSTLDASGLATGPDVAVDSWGERSNPNLRIALHESAGAIVAWGGRFGGVLVRRFDVAGAPVTLETGFGGSFASVVLAADGTAVLALQEPSVFDVYFQRLDTANASLGLGP